MEMLCASSLFSSAWPTFTLHSPSAAIWAPQGLCGAGDTQAKSLASSIRADTAAATTPGMVPAPRVGALHCFGVRIQELWGAHPQPHRGLCSSPTAWHLGALAAGRRVSAATLPQPQGTGSSPGTPTRLNPKGRLQCQCRVWQCPWDEEY